MPEDEEVRKILNRYEKKLQGKVGSVEFEEYPRPDKEFSREYVIFKNELFSGKVGFYEKFCKFAGRSIKSKPKPADEERLGEAIEIAHLDITPREAYAFAMFSVIFLVIIGILVTILPLLLMKGSLVFMGGILLILISLMLIKPLASIPVYIADRWRLRASNQMILCILYIVIYMRHTSNLEHAIKFAGDHVGNPLALDLRKIFWDVETGRFSNIKHSLDNYLNTWRNYNIEFVNAFHLVESSLYEPNEDRRIELLERSLKVILEGVHDRMMHYAQELRNPITMLHMLGVILPILGLVIFPLIGSFMGGSIRWYHLALLYNIILPILVFSFGMSVLSKRPTGYGESSFGYGKLPKPKGAVAFIWIIFFLIAIIPFIVVAFNPGFEMSMGDTFGDFFGFTEQGGPFGFGALLLSFALPLGLALGLSYYHGTRSKRLIKLRNETKLMEKEFSSAIFQLGNRVGDGIPVELAFGEVAENLGTTPVGIFFSRINHNIRQLGMSVKEAIFNKKNGAIVDNPSAVIESSMEVLIESSKKGPRVVARTMISISNYLNNIHKVNERLKDLLSEIVSSMKSQVSFLAPLIAGIVVGLATMIVSIISQLGAVVENIQSGGVTGSQQQFAGMIELATLFKLGDTIPSYFFQIVVGIYIVQVVYILTVLANGIENGADKITEEYMLSRNLKRSMFLYLVIALLVSVIFMAMSNVIMRGVGVT